MGKAKADMISKRLNAQTMARRLEEKGNGHTAAWKARTLAENREECAYLVNQALAQDSHLNFPKIHLLMHRSDQISQYSSLPQISIEICKASYKPLKKAHCRSNHIDSMSQIIKEYGYAHSITVKELEIEA